jgi:hypothetical protein
MLVDPDPPPALAREAATLGRPRGSLAGRFLSSQDERRERASGVVTAMLHVLIMDLPELQADVLAALVGAEPDMLVVGRGVGPDGLARSIEELLPDVVVMPRFRGESDTDALVGLAAWPHVGVIVLNETSGTIVRVAVVPNEGSWPARIIATIRTAAPQHVARHRLETDHPS